ncbi:response regulator transcription factor [Shumkonia mesophila]|uniref:response regulator transcription factor n=1 Tax=Shumkonia mesophila TaxID=2838854 RepID=UPI0029343560|nr:helix-turn-helix transcriptional regulator [Shumkonia mesophila]
MSEAPTIVVIIVLKPGASASAAPVCAAAEPKPGAAVDLSPREREILAGVARGECNKEIGRRLGIEADTAKAHLRNIFKKIGVANRTQAALWALKNLR